jgi:arabinogalactan oligomer/maltooligosaccharide transport system substrate-binding protein
VALDVIKFFTNAENSKALSLANKTIPANTAALNDPAIQALTTIQGFGASIHLGIPMANTPYAGAQWGPVGDATVAIWTGAQSVTDALAAAQKAIEEAIAGMQ